MTVAHGSPCGGHKRRRSGNTRTDAEGPQSGDALLKLGGGASSFVTTHRRQKTSQSQSLGAKRPDSRQQPALATLWPPSLGSSATDGDDGDDAGDDAGSELSLLEWGTFASLSLVEDSELDSEDATPGEGVCEGLLCSTTSNLSGSNSNSDKIDTNNSCFTFWALDQCSTSRLLAAAAELEAVEAREQEAVRDQEAAHKQEAAREQEAATALWVMACAADTWGMSDDDA